MTGTENDRVWKTRGGTFLRLVPADSAAPTQHPPQMQQARAPAPRSAPWPSKLDVLSPACALREYVMGALTRYLANRPPGAVPDVCEAIDILCGEEVTGYLPGARRQDSTVYLPLRGAGRPAATYLLSIQLPASLLLEWDKARAASATK